MQFKNLFRFSDKEEVLEAKEASRPVINSKVISADMHQTFDQVLKEFGLTASKESEIDELEAKLENFKKENQKVYDKIHKLQELGFVNTPSVKTQLSKLKDHELEINFQILEVKKKIDDAKRIERLHKEYLLKYPGYKFIDDDTMVSIMRKYNLVCGETFMYNREIPTEALNIISNFSKEIKESEGIAVLESYHLGMIRTFYDIKEVDEKYVDIRYRDSYDLGSTGRRILQVFRATKLKMIAPESHFTIPVRPETNYKGDTVMVPLMRLNESTMSYEFSANELNEVVQKRQEVLDPIASLKVDGGYIVLHAWDKEAEIPEIKNPMVN